MLPTNTVEFLKAYHRHLDWKTNLLIHLGVIEVKHYRENAFKIVLPYSGYKIYHEVKIDGNSINHYVIRDNSVIEFKQHKFEIKRLTLNNILIDILESYDRNLHNFPNLFMLITKLSHNELDEDNVHYINSLILMRIETKKEHINNILENKHSDFSKHINNILSENRGFNVPHYNFIRRNINEYKYGLGCPREERYNVSTGEYFRIKDIDDNDIFFLCMIPFNIKRVLYELRFLHKVMPIVMIMSIFSIAYKNEKYDFKNLIRDIDSECFDEFKKCTFKDYSRR